MKNHRDFELKDYLPYQVSMLAGMIRTTLKSEIEQRFALNLAEWRVMNTVAAFSPVTTKTISDHTTTAKADVSRAITRLVADGIMIRVVDPRDKRKVLLWFSDKGLELHRQLADFAIAWEDEWLREFSDDDRERTSAMMKRLIETLAARRGAADGKKVDTPE